MTNVEHSSFQLLVIVGSGLLAVGCSSAPWITTSALIVPNPVLLGPVTYVHGDKTSSPAETHPLPGVVSSLSSKHVASETQTYYGGGSTTTTLTLSKTSAGLQLGVAILREVTEHRFNGSTFSSFKYGLVAAPDRDFWHEPYRTSDVLVFRTFALTSTKLTVTDPGKSDVKENVILTLNGDKLVHAKVTP